MKYEADMMDYRRDGYKEGREEGRAEGKAEGRAEGWTQRENAFINKLRQMGMDEEFIKNAISVSDVPGAYASEPIENPD